MHHGLIRLTVAMSLSLSATPGLAQQGTGEIRGRVTDQQGGVLPGAVVVATHEETGVFRQVISGADGTYFVSQLYPGPYRITSTLEGFRSYERRGVVLAVGNTLTVDLTLVLGAVQESITVTGDSPLVDLTSAEVGGNIRTGELSELPATNRSVYAVVALLPGIEYVPAANFGSDTIIAGGQPRDASALMLDGGYNADDLRGSNGGSQVRTAMEAIQEFQVLTNQYDAEFGRSSGAVINAVTKQGTNKLHGSAYGSFTGSRFTARDFLVRQANLSKPESSLQQWGGTFGGPIVRNKAHYFFSLERIVEQPSRSRIFPTRPEFNYATTEQRSSWNTLFRLDHQISANHTWAFRWLREQSPQFRILTSARQTLATATDEMDLDQTLVANYTSAISNTKINTFRVAATLEEYSLANACWRETGNQAACPTTLEYLSFTAQTASNGFIGVDRNYQIEDTFSWFMPDKAGDHDLKFGMRYHFTELESENQANLNGSFFFNTDLAFDPDNPRTYPERLTIRVGGSSRQLLKAHTLEAFAQDKWRVNRRLTLSLGIRYDLEVTPISEADNPLFTNPGEYPVDANNLAPRLGMSYALDDAGKSVLRGGYGIFYNRTLLSVPNSFLSGARFQSSYVAQFPQDTVDPGPSRGLFPTHPLLVNGPTINLNVLNQLLPPGTLRRNTGTVNFDTPNRSQPFAHQVTFGYEREVAPMTSVAADYIRTRGRDMFLSKDLNPMFRSGTGRTDPITRMDAFGVLGEVYADRVLLSENEGQNNYDALNVHLEKRYSDSWGARVAYTLSSSRGTAQSQASRNLFQVGTNLNLDQLYGPADVDRRHNLAVSGRIEVPRTGGVTLSGVLHYLSGNPFTIHDTNIDANQNGEFFDPLAPGTYNGSGSNSLTDVPNEGGPNGARGPNFFQLDLRFGYRYRTAKMMTVDLFADAFNITDRVNWSNPSGDRRVASTFLALRTLYGSSGFPRQVQFGARFGF